VYVVNYWTFLVTKVNGTTGASLGEEKLPGRPFSVAVNPTTGTVYATDFLNKKITVLNG
jgi:DNA-binding beta-propeller fold protein YncE